MIGAHTARALAEFGYPRAGRPPSAATTEHIREQTEALAPPRSATQPSSSQPNRRQLQSAQNDHMKVICLV
jgi:hypothetical protein